MRDYIRLDFKEREHARTELLKNGKTMDFKISEVHTFNYHYNIAVTSPYMCIATIRLDYANKSVELNREFTQPLPNNKVAMMKMIGAWTRDHIWAVLSDGLTSREYGSDMWVAPANTKELKKLKSYVYLRSKRIGTIMGGRIWKEWLDMCGVSKEEMHEISRLAFRLSPSKNLHNVEYMNILYRLRVTLLPEVWAIVKSDMSKYNTSLCKWIMDIISSKSKYNLTQEEYCAIIKDSPELVRKCRYGFRWDNIQNISLNNTPIPENRWQWFTMRATMTYEPHMYGVSNTGIKEMNQFLSKVSHSDINMWHYYKRAYHISQPYSFRRIIHMIQVVCDGMRLYEQYKDNGLEIPFVQVNGSPMRMLRNSVYNHRQQQELQKKQRLSTKNWMMPEPPIKLPTWVENIRIKTAHDMIRAGIECEHCIGGYTTSNDIFVREGNVCAQIMRHNLEIGQCYDFKDSITNKSKELQRKLNKDLKPLREVIESVK
jgi:hypothetical protein